MSLAITVVSNLLAEYPKKMVVFSLTNSNIPAAGISVTPANFGLDTLDDIISAPVQIAGSVNTQTLLMKYDPATGKVFFFGQADDTSTTVAKPLAIIPGDISAVPTVTGIAVGNDVNN